MSGAVLIALAFGLGIAAYNSASNILFIALSILLASLIFSGVLAWLNLMGVTWRMEVEPPFRAGMETAVGLELHNAKSFVPTYALWFEFTATAVRAGGPGRPETTLTGKGIDWRAALARVSEVEAHGKARLRDRLDSGATSRLEWRFTPARRGVLQIELRGVGSLFPFGFLKKLTGTDQQRKVFVWPAPVEYRRFAAGDARRPTGEQRLKRAGSGGDPLALRRYEQGDSHRLIHWKASARTGKLLVRQFAAETSEAYAIWLRTDADAWPRPAQFELLLSLAATLAEDLFRAGRLHELVIDGDPAIPVRGVADLEAFLDRLAEARPGATGSRQARLPAVGAGGRSLMTFAPDGLHGVAAYADGIKAAAA